MDIEKKKMFYYKDNYFQLLNKEQLIQLIDQKKDYQDFLYIFKKEYIDLYISYKDKHISIEEHILKNKAYTLKNNEKAQLYYLFFMIQKKPVGITKILTIEKKNDFFQKIISFLQCNYHDIVFLFNTFVSNQYRGRGINKLFLKYIVKNILKKYIIVAIKDDNQSSIKSHIDSGFIKTNIIAYYPDNYFYYLPIKL
jgi:hypothetical protein